MAALASRSKTHLNGSVWGYKVIRLASMCDSIVLKSTVIRMLFSCLAYSTLSRFLDEECLVKAKDFWDNPLPPLLLKVIPRQVASDQARGREGGKGEKLSVASQERELTDCLSGAQRRRSVPLWASRHHARHRGRLCWLSRIPA